MEPVGFGSLAAALVSAQDSLRQVSELVEGEVAHLRGNGWTDAQARAIVATSFGWQSPDDETED